MRLLQQLRFVIRSARGYMLSTTVLIGFFLFVFAVFFGAYLQARGFAGAVTEKLGMYFYVEEVVSSDDIVYTQLQELQGLLERHGMEVTYQSRTAALEQLFGESDPDLIEQLNRAGIGNPLPATLYVVFDNEAELRLLKKAIKKYEGVIVNVDELDAIERLDDQENRNLTAIRVAQLLTGLSLVFLLILGLGIVSMVVHVLQRLYALFADTVQLQVLLGASYWQVLSPFVLLTVIMLLGASVLAGVLLQVGGWVMQQQLASVFSLDLWASYVVPYQHMLATSFWVMVVSVLLLGAAFSAVYSLILVNRR